MSLRHLICVVAMLGLLGGAASAQHIESDYRGGLTRTAPHTFGLLMRVPSNGMQLESRRRSV
jgi:hypothetical protein